MMRKRRKRQPAIAMLFRFSFLRPVNSFSRESSCFLTVRTSSSSATLCSSDRFVLRSFVSIWSSWKRYSCTAA
uniref:Putative secreted protein n=1 Tax=Ixodes ricinus TaxID=34613 RepID=A0A6B0UAB9_IXORI